MAIGKKVLKLRAQKKKFTFKYEGPSADAVAKGRYYPADDEVTPKGPTPVRNAPKVRSSITEGSVLILIAGRFRGKRVICLKKLSSGLLLVTGPYSVNKVPLRRVNQRYVIATSQKVSLAGVDASKIDDSFFKRSKNESDKTLSNERKAAQTAIDTPLSASIKKVELLESYLKSNFTLKNSDKPHNMKF